MSLPIFIEILSHDGEVKNRYKCEKLPISLGRAYDNDIIIDDLHVAPHHARIELNQLDELIISDLGSRNGISLDNHCESFFLLNDEKRYRIGRTYIRVRGINYHVPPEIADSTNHQWEGWRPAASGAVLLIITSLISTWLSDLNESSLSKYLLELVSVIGFATVWSGFWALFSKLFSGQTRFGRHVFIASCSIVVLELWTHVSGVVAYAFSWETLAKFNNHPVIYLCAIVLYFHLLTAGNRPSHKLKVYLSSLALIASGIIMTKQYQETSHLADTLYMSQIYPPVVRLSRDHSLEALTTEIFSLKQRVDKARKENPDKDPDPLINIIPSE